MRFRAGLLTTLLLLLAGCGGDGAEKAAAPPAEQVLRWGIIGESGPDDTSWDALTDIPINTPWNVFDPLVKVDEELQAVPNVAERWEWSEDRRTITFHLRRDGRWTNGDPLTAHDYVFGWRHTLQEDRPSESAGIFSVIAGADAYISCDPEKRECEPLWDDVGVRALDDHTLEVRLTEPQPWFPDIVGGFSCVCFSGLHRETVERYGDDWAEPEHIVTSGPFKVESWSRDELLVLVRNEQWRGAADVALERIEIRFFRERKMADAVRAFEAGELDVTDAQVGAEEHRAVYPFLKTQFVAVDVEKVPDARQRRAMALAVDRRTIVEKVPVGEARAGTSVTPDGMPGFGRIASRFLEPDARLEEARRLLAAVPEPHRTIELWAVDLPVWRAEATEIAAAWRRLGIETTVRALPWDEFSKQVPTRRLGEAVLANWVYDAPDPANLYDQFRCGDQYYPLGYCDPVYDDLLDRAAREPDAEARLGLYAQAEARLTGREGTMPVIPLWWGSRTRLESASARETFELNKAGQVDLTKVRLRGG